MKDLIITGANQQHFDFLRLFVESLRTYGEYTGYIAVCDNSIGGSWDNPGKYAETHSFNEEQMQFLSKHQVEVYPYGELIKSNGIDRELIDRIPSYTQRYPHKYVYTTLLSKLYLKKARNICFFDADIYFQKPLAPLLEAMSEEGIYMVREYQKIGKSPFLKKWIAHTDFSKLSSQEAYEKSMFGSEDYCTGFFGGKAPHFHRLCLLALLLTSNHFVEFYSDQPLMNILKSFFQYPIRELSDEYVMHLGELPKEDLVVRNKQLFYKNKASIAVHFNGGTKDLFELIVGEKEYQIPSSERLRHKLKREFGMRIAPLRKYLKI